MVSTVEAKNGENLPNRIGVNYYTYNDAVNFFENGIEFFIFSNGDFDFDINSANRRIPIDRDFRGRINRIGNVSLRYDFRGNVTRIGTISIRYFRDRLTRVGDLRVGYDRWGYPIFNGNVRNFYYNDGIRFHINFGDVLNYNDAFFRNNNFNLNYNQIREDRNFYYYRARPNARIGDRNTIIKRRKSVTVRGANNDISRRKSNNSYRKNEVNKRTPSNRNATDSSRQINSRKKVKISPGDANRKVDSKRRTIDNTNRNVDTKRKVKTDRNKSDVKKKKENKRSKIVNY